MRQKDRIGGRPEGRTRNRDAKFDGKDGLVGFIEAGIAGVVPGWCIPLALVETARYLNFFA